MFFFFFSGGELFKEPYKLLYKKKRDTEGVSSLGSLRSHLAAPPPCRRYFLPQLVFPFPDVTNDRRRLGPCPFKTRVNYYNGTRRENSLARDGSNIFTSFFSPPFFLLLLTLLNCFQLMEKKNFSNQ